MSVSIRRSYDVNKNKTIEKTNPEPKYEPFDFSQIDTSTIEQKEQESDIPKKKRRTKK